MRIHIDAGFDLQPGGWRAYDADGDCICFHVGATIMACDDIERIVRIVCATDVYDAVKANHAFIFAILQTGTRH